MEVHTIAELERILKLQVLDRSCMLGINNRDLETFKVDLDNNRVIMESAAGRRLWRVGSSLLGSPAFLHPSTSNLSRSDWKFTLPLLPWHPVWLAVRGGFTSMHFWRMKESACVIVEGVGNEEGCVDKPIPLSARVCSEILALTHRWRDSFCCCPLAAILD